MRPLFARLLTRTVRAFHAVVHRLLGRTARRRRPEAEVERDRRARLNLSSMEARDHTGSLAGGVVLAALGYQFTDPLQGMASAVGDLAMLSALPPDAASQPTVGDPPRPLTDWLPDDLDAALALRSNDGEVARGNSLPPGGPVKGAAGSPLDDFWALPVGAGSPAAPTAFPDPPVGGANPGGSSGASGASDDGRNDAGGAGTMSPAPDSGSDPVARPGATDTGPVAMPDANRSTEPGAPMALPAGAGTQPSTPPAESPVAPALTGAPVLNAVYRYGEGPGARLFVDGTAPAGAASTIDIFGAGRRIGSAQAVASGFASATFRAVLPASLAAGEFVTAALGGVASAPVSAGAGPDGDLDGVPDWVESLDPRGASINAAARPGVASLPSAVRDAFVTLDAGTYRLRNVRALAPPPDAAPSSFPFGLFDFTVEGVTPGGAATVEYILPEGERPAGYFKWDLATGIVSDFAFDGATGATFDGNVVTLHLVDGGRGDADGLANGVIVDPSGSGTDSVASPEDAEVTVEAMDWTASESGASTGVFRIARDGEGDISTSLTVYYFLSGTAVNGQDYEYLPGSVTIPAGQTSVPVFITPIDDSELEGPESVTLTLYEDGGRRVDRVATVSLNDDDDLGGLGATGGVVRLGVVALADAAETDSAAVFAVTRSGGDLSQPLTVRYALGGTAVPNTDYTPPSGSVTFGPNQTAVAVRIVPVDAPEVREVRTVTLGGLAADGQPSEVVGSGVAVVSLTDRSTPEDEELAAVVGVVASIPDTPEGGLGEFTFTRAGGDLSRPLTVDFYVSGSALWRPDYELFGPPVRGQDDEASGPTPLRVRFAPYASAATAFVLAEQDDEAEGDETVVVTLMPVAGSVVDPTRGGATVTIVGDGGGMSMLSPLGGGGGGEQGLAPAGDGQDGGLAPLDHDGSDGTIVPGSGGPVSGGSGGESGGGVSGGSGVPVVVTIGPAEQGVSEGGTTGVWVSRSGGDTSHSLTVNLGIGADGQNDQPATWGTDYTLTAPSGGSLGAGGGSVTFAAYQTQVYVGVSALRDNVIEPTEGFRLSVLGGSGYQAGYYVDASGGSGGGWFGRDADVRIADDPAVVTVGPVVQSVSEGGQTGVWVYRSGGDPSLSLTVSLSIGPDGQNPPATWNVDYTLTGPAGSALGSTGGSVTFDPYQTQVYLPVAALSDNLIEPTEGFRVSVLGGGSVYQAGYYVPASGGGGEWVGRDADVRIGDNPAVVTVGPATQSVVEGGAAGVWVSRSGGDTTQGLTVYLSIGADGQNDPLATWDVDYILTGPGGGSSALGAGGGSVTFGPGVTQAYLNVSARRDNLVEPTEGFRVQVLGGGSVYQAGYFVPASGGGGTWVGREADVRITDDPAVVTIAPASQSVLEGGAGAVTVYRSGGDTSAALTVSLGIGADGQGDPLATWDVDYTLTGPSQSVALNAGGGTVAFGAGVTLVTLNVSARRDNLVEGTEGFRLTVLGGGSTYQAGTTGGGSSGATADVRITDLPVVTVAWVRDAVEPSPDGPGVVGRFRVSRSGPTTGDLYVSLSIGGTATPGADYTPLSTIARIPAGQSSIDIDVAALMDELVEGTETVTVTVVAASAYEIGTPGQTTVQIIDVPPKPELLAHAIDPVSSEYQNSTGRIRVVRLGNTSAAVSVPLSASGDATPGLDYGALPGSVSLPAGARTAGVTVTPVTDQSEERAESVRVALGAVDGHRVAGPPARSVVRNYNDLPVTTALVTMQALGNVLEGEVGLVRFTRTGSDDRTIRVRYVLSDTSTATPEIDFEQLFGDIVIPAGETSVDLRIETKPDNRVEGSESVVLTLLGGVGYAIGAGASAALNVLDALPVVTVQPTANTSEGSSEPGKFTFSRVGGDWSEPLIVYFTAGGQAKEGEDYAAFTGLVTIPAGEGSTVVEVRALRDNRVEGQESVEVTITEAETYRLGTSYTTYIAIDDDPPTVDVFPGAIAKEGTTGTIVFARTGGHRDEDLVVPYMVGGTATPGPDYAILTGVVTIPAGQDRAEIELIARADNAVEGNETVVITLGAGDFQIEGTGTATATIEDDPPVVTLKRYSPVEGIDVTDAYEGSSPTIEVHRSGGDRVQPLTVRYSVGGTATAGTDYERLSGEYRFESGDTVALLFITALPDNLIEGDETVVVTLTPGGYQIADGTLTAKILDDVPTVSVAVGRDVAEPGTAGEFVFTRQGGDIDGPLTVYFTTIPLDPRSATEATDYEPIPREVKFLGRERTVTLPVIPINDGEVEGPETVTLALTAGSYQAVGTGTAIMTVADDDLPDGGDMDLTLPGVVTEGETVPLTVRLNAAQPGHPYQLTIDWGDGTTSGPTLYTAGEDPLVVEATHVYTDDEPSPGNATPQDVHTVTVTMAAGSTVFKHTRSLIVRNALPTAVDVVIHRDDEPRPSTDPRGDRMELDATVTDPGTGDSHTVRVDWGDGTAPTEAQAIGGILRGLAHTYEVGSAPGTVPERVFNVTVSVADDDEPGRFQQLNTYRLVLPSRAPFLQITNLPEVAYEGNTVSIRGVLGNPGTADWGQVEIDWGDGTKKYVDLYRENDRFPNDPTSKQFSTALGFEATYTYPDNLTPRTVVVTVLTRDGAVRLSDSRPLPVLNVAPAGVRVVVEAVGSKPENGQAPVKLSGTFTDPGLRDTHKVVIDWGDNSVPTTIDLVRGEGYVEGDVFKFAVSAPHMYAVDTNTGALFKITVSVGDGDEPDKPGKGYSRFVVAKPGEVLQTFYDQATKVQADPPPDQEESFFDVVIASVGNLVTLVAEKAKQFTDAVGDFIDKLRELEAIATDLFGDDGVPKILRALTADPGAFVTNFIEAARRGFTEFFDPNNLPDVLKQVALNWVRNKLDQLDLNLTAADLPEFNPNDPAGTTASIAGFVLKAMGLTWDDLVARATSKIGADNVQLITRAYEFVKARLDDPNSNTQKGFLESLPGIVKDALTELLPPGTDPQQAANALLDSIFDPAGLKDKALAAIKDYVKEVLPQKLIEFIGKKLAVPSVGSFLAIYDTVKWVLSNTQYLNDLKDLFKQVAAKADDIRQGNLDGTVQTIKDGLVKVAEMALDFGVTQVGLAELPAGVVVAVKRRKAQVNAKIDLVIDKTIGAVTARLDKILSKVVGGTKADYTNLVGHVIPWTIGPRKDAHRFWAVVDTKANNGAGAIRFMLASDPTDVDATFAAWEVYANGDIDWVGDATLKGLVADAKLALPAIKAKLQAVLTATVELIKGMNKPLPVPTKQKDIDARNAAIRAELAKVQQKVTDLQLDEGDPNAATLAPFPTKLKAIHEQLKDRVGDYQVGLKQINTFRNVLTAAGVLKDRRLVASFNLNRASGDRRSSKTLTDAWRQNVLPTGTPIIYVLIDRTTGNVMKVGQTVEWSRRFNDYRNWAITERQISVYAFDATGQNLGTLEKAARTAIYNTGQVLPYDYTQEANDEGTQGHWWRTRANDAHKNPVGTDQFQHSPLAPTIDKVVEKTGLKGLKSIEVDLNYRAWSDNIPEGRFIYLLEDRKAANDSLRLLKVGSVYGTAAEVVGRFAEYRARALHRGSLTLHLFEVSSKVAQGGKLLKDFEMEQVREKLFNVETPGAGKPLLPDDHEPNETDWRPSKSVYSTNKDNTDPNTMTEDKVGPRPVIPGLGGR